jgi:hypothetical protein
MSKFVLILLTCSFFLNAFGAEEKTNGVVFKLYKHGTAEEIQNCQQIKCIRNISDDELRKISNYRLKKNFEAIVPFGKTLNSDFERISKMDKLLLDHMSYDPYATYENFTFHPIAILLGVLYILVLSFALVLLRKSVKYSLWLPWCTIVSLVLGVLGGPIVLVTAIAINGIFCIYLLKRKTGQEVFIFFLEQGDVEAKIGRLLRIYLPFSFLFLSLCRLAFVFNRYFLSLERTTSPYIPTFIIETLFIGIILQIVTLYISRIETAILLEMKSTIKPEAQF